MLASQVPTIATLYSQWVYIYVLSFGIAVILTAAFLYLKVQKAMIHMMDEKIIASQRKLDVSAANDANNGNTNEEEEEEVGIKYE